MLTIEEKALIKSTIPLLKEQGYDLVSYFYQRMLSRSPELKNLFNLDHQKSGAQAKALAASLVAYAENIDNLENLTPVISLIANKHTSLNIQAKDYQIVGENLLATLHEVLHVPYESDLMQAWEKAYMALAEVFIQSERDIYNNTVTQGGWEGWKNVRVIKKQPETDNITSIYFATLDGSRLPEFKPGQYISVRVFIPELDIYQPRQYTLSTSYNNQYYRISVKREPRNDNATFLGYVTNVLHDKLAEGDTIEISAPFGDFYLQDTQRHAVLISAGVGITPMMSMLDYFCKKQTPENLTFVHMARLSKDRPFEQEIGTLSEQYPQLNIALWQDDEPQTRYANINYFNAPSTLADLNLSITNSAVDYYLCGSMDFMLQQKMVLTALGVSADHIFMEIFDTGGISA